SGNFVQSVLAPAGPQAFAIHHLWTWMLWISIVIYLVVHVALYAGLLRRQSHPQNPPSSEASLSKGVSAAVAVSALILLALLGASIWVARTITPVQASEATTIDVIGHQWWWEIEYEDSV